MLPDKSILANWLSVQRNIVMPDAEARLVILFSMLELQLRLVSVLPDLNFRLVNWLTLQSKVARAGHGLTSKVANWLSCAVRS